MAGLEASLRITAKDEAGSALKQIKAQIAALDKSIATFDKLMTAAGKVAKATDPMISSIAASSKALNQQKLAVTELGESLTGLGGSADVAAGGQRALASATERTTAVMVAQGAEAVRISEQIAAAQRKSNAAARGGARSKINEALPFPGPTILHETAKAAEAGGTVQEEIARLIAAGSTPAQIRKARDDFIAFSRTHSGVLEADYLAAYRDARVIAPTEAYEMTGLGARYRAALRNSGLSSTEYDVGNVLRIMDELGLKTNGDREEFLNSFLKSQQAFGSQISTETALAAYRNAKQSIYSWSPEFREKYFPTLLQSAGQQGGTEMMTALNNYVGHHMQKTEIESLVKAGFVRPQDVKTDHGRTTFRDNAKLFESDLFKSNIAQWAWDFHDLFMGRRGASEDKFDDLIAKMPRNMAGLIAFLVHNRSRIQRDAETLGLPIGLAAAEDKSLAQNPAAGLDALKNSLTQFAAAMTAPGMDAVGPGLQSLAHGVQAMAAAYEEWSKAHPKAAEAASVGGMAGAAGAGGWLTWKLFTGIGRLFGFGGGAAGEGTAAGIAAGAAGGGGVLSALGAAVLTGAEALAPVIMMRAIGEAANPTTAAGAKYRVDTAWATQMWDIERGRRAEQAWRADPEAARGRAMMALGSGGVSVDVRGAAQVDQTLHVDVSLAPGLQATLDAVRSFVFSVPMAPTGRSDSDAAPQRGAYGLPGHL